jgi:GNAT superfamily N-acetyltransferase
MPPARQGGSPRLQEIVVRLTNGAVVFRRGTSDDLEAIVALLADDPLGRERESPAPQLDACYRDAFAAIDRDPNQLLAVAERGGRVVGVLQLSFIPGLTRRGMWRGQIEGVRVAASERGGGVGRAMLEWAIAECRKRGGGLVQLTSDERRPDAHSFYEVLGFRATHRGYKLAL